MRICNTAAAFLFSSYEISEAKYQGICSAMVVKNCVASRNIPVAVWLCVCNGHANPLTSNDPYSRRTAPLTSKRCILYIYSTNIGTEYFKHGIYSPFFFSSKCSLFHNSNLFGSCIIHVLYTRCAKI